MSDKEETIQEKRVKEEVYRRFDRNYTNRVIAKEVESLDNKPPADMLNNEIRIRIRENFGQIVFKNDNKFYMFPYVKADSGFMWFPDKAAVWEDLRISGSSTRLGASAPDLVSFLAAGDLMANGFNGASTTEMVYFEQQIPHAYKEWSDIDAHVHWSPTTSAAGNVKWQLEYSWANIDSVFPASATISGTDSTDSTAWKHLLCDIGDIDGTEKTLSSMFVCRLFRDPTDSDDTYGADAILLEIDFHVELDTLGSDLEYVKGILR